MPFAGGYASSFIPFRKHFNGDWKIIAVNPPGHGSNTSPLIYDLEKLIHLYIEELEPYFHETFVLFGHSMGGRIVHRMAQILESGGIFPEKVIVSASTPPRSPITQCSELYDEKFLEYVFSLGGIPKEVIMNKELLNSFLPSLRADFEAMENHVYLNEIQLVSPLYVISGTSDESCLPNKAKGWAECSRSIRLIMINAGHMFLINQPHDTALLIEMILTQKMDEPLTEGRYPRSELL